MGHGTLAGPVTTEPDVRIAVAGRELRPVAIIGDCYRFVLPAGCESVRLLSRAGAPADMEPWQEDQRRLGLLVRRIALWEGDALTEMAMDDPALVAGWWTVERHGRRLVRWTDGNAVLPLGVGGVRMLEITAGCRDAYPEDQPAVTSRAA